MQGKCVQEQVTCGRSFSARPDCYRQTVELAERQWLAVVGEESGRH
jgi:hypothetical protein